MSRRRTIQRLLRIVPFFVITSRFSSASFLFIATEAFRVTLARNLHHGSRKDLTLIYRRSRNMIERQRRINIVDVLQELKKVHVFLKRDAL